MLEYFSIINFTCSVIHRQGAMNVRSLLRSGVNATSVGLHIRRMLKWWRDNWTAKVNDEVSKTHGKVRLMIFTYHYRKKKADWYHSFVQLNNELIWVFAATISWVKLLYIFSLVDNFADSCCSSVLLVQYTNQYHFQFVS